MSNETGCNRLLFLVAAIAGILALCVAIIAYLFPLNPVGPSPLVLLVNTPQANQSTPRMVVSTALPEAPSETPFREEPTIATLPTSIPTVEPTATTPPTPMPTRILIPDYEQLSLQANSELSSPETNLGLEPGINSLLGIPFENGWKASTQCSHLPDRPTYLHFDTNAPRPQNVYLLLQAGWGLVEYRGKQIGRVDLLFSNGTKAGLDLILGETIRDWSTSDPRAVSPVSIDASREAWRGLAPDGVTPGRMDILTLGIPDPLKETTLTGIDISDISYNTAGNIDPCIHLLAITVKYLH